MTWQTDIPMSDIGWREISLSSKHPEGANVRFSPIIDNNNIAGRILHEEVNGKVSGIINATYEYEDDRYTWWPISITDGYLDHEPYLWIAIEVFYYELGDFINVGAPEPEPEPPVEEPLFYDLPFGKHGTVRILEEDMNFVVIALHELADFAEGFVFAFPRMEVVAMALRAFADYLGEMEGVK